MDMNKQDTYVKKAIVDIANTLADTFKKYSMNTRKKAWKDIISPKGRVQVDKLVRNPNRAINRFQILAFREWLEEK